MDEPTMDDKTHDGFTNFETWAVAVWIDNDRTNYHYWRDEARRHCSLALEREQVAEGINSGIVYLMAFPYLLVAVAFYLFYRNWKRSRLQ